MHGVNIFARLLVLCHCLTACLLVICGHRMLLQGQFAGYAPVMAGGL